MIAAKFSDKERIAKLLTNAFDTNKSINFVVKQNERRVQRIEQLMKYSFDNCWHSGEIYMTDDQTGVVLLLFPERKRISFRSVISDISLVINTIGINRVKTVLKREKKIKQSYPSKYIHLWYIGVLPEHQREGKGSLLLKGVNDISDKLQLPVFLETSVIDNIRLYERFGFKVFKEIDLGYKLYLLKRDFQ